jgi:hypothetical protein
MSPASPAWVLQSLLRRPVPADGTKGLLVGGVLVLSADAPTTLRTQVLVDGAPVRTRWGLPSPKVAADFPEAANATRARFRAGPLPARGALVEVAVEDPATGTRLVTASLALPSDPQLVPEDVAAVRRRADALIAGEEREAAEYDALRAGLERVDEAERGPAWLEAAILVAGAFRERPRATFRRLGELRRLRREDGQADAFDDFHSTFVRLLAPYTLNAHGYQTSLNSLNPDEVWAGVESISSHLAELGHQCFANSGTLLGLVREARLIGHDDDVDLAVLLHASDLTDVAAEWVTLRHQLAGAGLLDAEFEARRRTHCKVRLTDGTKVDLFPAWLSETGRVYVWPHTRGKLMREDLLPFERFRIGEVQINLPHRPERLLEANYGPEWRTPDPTWRFDWPGAKRQFSGFVAAMTAAWDASGMTS